MTRHTTFRTRPNATLVGLLLLASLTGCGDTPLPTEPDPCPADLAMMAGHWTGMAGDVRVTMQLAPTRFSDTFFGFTTMHDAMSGAGMADHPEDSRNVTFSVKFWCFLGTISSSAMADAPPPEPGAPMMSSYWVARLDVVSVSSTELVVDLRRAAPHTTLPNPFDTDLRIVFERPPT
ncbi:MAG: hypothetical protein ABR551_09345 [Gemmatimonadales bacterium]